MTPEELAMTAARDKSGDEVPPAESGEASSFDESSGESWRKNFPGRKAAADRAAVFDLILDEFSGDIAESGDRRRYAPSEMRLLQAG